MKLLVSVGRYLWKFFVGDALQLIGLIVAFGLVALLVHPLRAWAGVAALVLVMAVIWIDAFRLHTSGRKW